MKHYLVDFGAFEASWKILILKSSDSSVGRRSTMKNAVPEYNKWHGLKSILGTFEGFGQKYFF